MSIASICPECADFPGAISENMDPIHKRTPTSMYPMLTLCVSMFGLITVPIIDPIMDPAVGCVIGPMIGPIIGDIVGLLRGSRHP